jgi:uncharacterized repeat protein (TIGR03803 family)
VGIDHSEEHLPIGSDHCRCGSRLDQRKMFSVDSRLLLSMAALAATIHSTAYAQPTLTILESFNGTNGAYPATGMLMDSGGNLYGTTPDGGTGTSSFNGQPLGAGTTFELFGSNHTFSVLTNFSNTSVSYPLGGLIQDTGGNLYGTSGLNAGTVFEVVSGTNEVQTLASFTNTSTTGTTPSTLSMDSQGNFYGTTRFGGSPSGYGRVFEVSGSSHSISTLAVFNGVSGENPQGVFADGAGDLFGTTVNGGNGGGTVYEIAAGSNAITVLTKAPSSSGGYFNASLVSDKEGNVYGTTESGGAFGGGTVFKISAGSHNYSTVASFNSATGGAVPYAQMISDAAGDLFGLTANPARVFEIPAGTNTIETLAALSGNSSTSGNGLTMDAAGDLFGVTYAGGSSGAGSVFEIASNTGAFSTLWSFLGSGGGSNPEGTLSVDSSGNLYGITSGGGAYGFGTVYEITGVPEPTRGSSTVLLAMCLIGRRHHRKLNERIRHVFME